MRPFIPTLVFLVLTATLQAQQFNPTGIYYLEGVMETASGIKFNSDSTFEFFFSQGALDRTGKGRWSVQGDELLLQSDSLPVKGFTLVKSEKIISDKNKVIVKEENVMLLSFVYVQISTKGPTEFLKLGTEGTLESENGKVSKIEFLFELCPERIHEFSPIHDGDNYFEFTMHPEIMEVYFDKIVLMKTEAGLSGQHPLLLGSEFFYRKKM